MTIDKKELNEKFAENDWNYVFNKAYEISKFVIVRNFNILDGDSKEELAQRCVTDLWEKIIKNKHKKYKKNMFSFIYNNSNFKVKDILKSVNNRNKIAQFVTLEENMDFKDKRIKSF